MRPSPLYTYLRKLMPVLMLGIGFLIASFFFHHAEVMHPSTDNRSLGSAASYPELENVENKQLSFGELSAFFKKLAQEKGAVYAFDALRVAHLPPDTDLHLLGHTVGDELYKQKGLQGISVCTNEFRNACSHSIVIGLLMEKGENALPSIAEACRQAPGGSGAYTMCYHGLGHGILAYAGYDLGRGVKLCEKTGNSGEAPQCIGGAIMEIISGGGHNHEQWAGERKKWLKPAESLYPCMQDFMPANGRIFCLIYITPYLWEAAGADIGHPDGKDFAASFKFCDALATSDVAGRNACFGGFGKEFTTLANDRDIRNVDQMDSNRMRQVYDWCVLAQNKNGIAACVAAAMNSLYWGGENKPEGAIRFCNAIPDEFQQRSCVMNLIQSVRAYRSDDAYRQEFCKDIPTQYQKQCSATLL